MAIKIITGVPGSGKTYYAVHQVLLKWYRWDNKFDEYVPKQDKKLMIFTNIDSLKLPHISIEDYLRRHDLTLEKFFTVDYQKKLVSRYSNLVYIIDEAQRFFPSRFNNTEVLFFFQYHRHLGIDIYLITQSIDSISKHISALAEFYIQAVRPSFRFLNEFRYHFIAGGQKIGHKVVKADKRVFALYRSFEAESVEKPPRPLRKYALIFAILLLLVISSFYFFFHAFFSPPSQSESKPAKLSSSRSHSSPVPNPRFRSFPSRALASSPPARVRRRAPGTASTPTPPPSPTGSLASLPVRLRVDPRALASFKADDYVLFRTSGMWVGDDLYAIQWMGKIYSLDHFPFPFFDDGRSVYVFFPKRALQGVQVAEPPSGLVSVKNNLHKAVSLGGGL